MLSFLRNNLTRIGKDEGGNFAILTALALVPLFTGASIAINLARINLESAKMQDGLDAAAFSAVKSYGEGANESKAKDLANNTFFANFGTPEIVADIGSEGSSAPVESQAIKVAFGTLGVETTATATYELKYAPLFWGLKPYTIDRASVAARMPGREACMLALSPTATRAFEVSGSASVDTSGCTITSNSSDAQSIYLSGSATLKAECLYATGKVSATLAHLTLACPKAVEDVAPISDPFGSKKMPTTGSWVSLAGCGQNFVAGGGGNGDCNGTSKTPNNAPAGYTVQLKPGTYGGLEIKGKVLLRPGYYIIDGGNLKFASQSVISGEGVTFFLLNGAQLDIHGGSTFKVTPSLTGEWAGFAIVAARNNTAPATINGNSASSLAGIIYMPASNEIQYAGNGSTGGECVRIVAQEITMIGNSSFKLDCKAALANNTINNPGAIRLVR
ncbi:pilus assembly protein [Ensifer adhaerens]|uniref:TadE/TadG family type IV pilus assembly protein n=1 Tax=Ensifer adhaerens TaxID=106592 RepID=UPI0023A933A8|nr:TadE/TadG family type IV pilus assembly protein [Ensifer adhaerens]WDZ78205.1 pilus assembly protein [Ensifer adhaerens]